MLGWRCSSVEKWRVITEYAQGPKFHSQHHENKIPGGWSIPCTNWVSGGRMQTPVFFLIPQVTTMYSTTKFENQQLQLLIFPSSSSWRWDRQKAQKNSEGSYDGFPLLQRKGQVPSRQKAVRKPRHSGDWCWVVRHVYLPWLIAQLKDPGPECSLRFVVIKMLLSPSVC